MTIRSINLTLSTYVGEGIEQTCTTRDLTERDFTATQLAALSHIFANAGRDPAAPQPQPETQPQSEQTLGEVVAKKHMANKATAAKQQGYTGDSCDQCGSFAIKRTGKCTTCENCMATGGCG